VPPTGAAREGWTVTLGRVEPTVALVPLRAPGAGKTRLAGHLDVDQRAALAGAMLADVAAVLVGCRALDRVVVAAGGPSAVAAAAALGLEVVADPPHVRGLDGALRAAALRIGHARQLLVVAADLPTLTPDDVDAVLACPAAVTVAPTRDGGTGALLRRPPDAITTTYGPGSCRRHLRLARAAGWTTAVVDRPGFAFDLDTVEDLRLAGTGRVGPATAAVLAALPTGDERAG
jgi:2-phospho-L-lactate/phosphoenolpyruvate guanylyltransferase